MDRAKLTAELTRDEAFKPLVYDDATGKPLTKGSVCQGHPTVGIGRCLDTNGITQAEAMYLLQNDITATELRLTRAFPWFAELDDVRQRAITNWAFNVGIARIQEFVNAVDAIGRQEWDRAADAMLDSHWARQVGDRAKRLAAMIRTGATA